MSGSNQVWWAPIPEWVTWPEHFRKMDQGRALGLYIHLRIKADRKSGKLYRRYETIKRETGMSLRTIQRRMKTLEDGGYILTVRFSHKLLIEILGWENSKSSAMYGESEKESSATHDAVIRHGCRSDSPSVTRSATHGESENILNTKRNQLSSATHGESIKTSFIKSSFINRKKKGYHFLKFMNFAKRCHKKIISSTLVETKNDSVKINTLLDKFSVDVLSIAFVDFLKSGDPYLQDKPRNVPVFAGQISNLIECANAVHRKSQNKFAQIFIRPECSKLSGADNQTWKRCLDKIEEEILPSNFDSWIKPLVFGGAVNGHISVICPDSQSRAAVKENYLEMLEVESSRAFGRDVNVKLTTASNL